MGDTRHVQNILFRKLNTEGKGYMEDLRVYGWIKTY